MAANRSYDVTATADPTGDALANEVVEEGNALWLRIVTALTTNGALSTASAYVANASPPLLIIDANTILSFRPSVDSAANPTLAIDALAAIPLLDILGSSSPAGTFKAGLTYLLVGAAGGGSLRPIATMPATGSVGTGSIADGSVTLAKLAANSVDATKIVDGSVGTAELAGGAVTGVKLAANSVDATKIVDGSIGAAELAAGVAVPQAEFDVLEAEVVAAREGEASLDAKLDSMEAATAGRVPQSRIIAAAGLATGGGDLSADRTIAVAKAAPAAVIAGTDDASGVTPLGNKAALDARIVPIEERIEGIDQQARLVLSSGGRSALPEATAIDFTFSNADKQNLLGILADGRTLAHRMRVQKAIELGNDALVDFVDLWNAHFAVTATDRKKIFSIDLDGSQFLRGPTRFGSEALGLIIHTGRWNVDFAFIAHDRKIICTAADLASIGSVDSAADADAQNRALAVSDRSGVITGIAGLEAAYNIIAEYGQSNANGSESWPPLSTAVDAAAGVLMYGNDVRPSSGDGPAFAPLGGAALNTIKAVVPNGAGGVMTAGEIAALAPGTVALGETSAISAVIVLRLLTNGTRGEDTATDHKFVVINGGVGGKNIAQLSKVNPVDGTDRYSRIVNGTDGVMDIVEAMPKTGQVSALLWIGNESDYLGEASSTGAAGTRAEVKAALATLYADYCTDLAARTGQAYPPAMFIVTTGGPYARNVDDSGNLDPYVNMAHWEFCRETPHAFLAGPYYHVTDKLNHLDANGVRWLGCKVGEAMHRVLVERRNWEPLAPSKCERSGAVIRIDFPTETPLRFRPFYRAINNSGGALEEVILANKGFYVTTTTGTLLTITSVIILETSIVEITLAVTPPGDTLVWYTRDLGGAAGDGCGNLCNTKLLDPLIAYEYLAGSGMYAVADIPALVDEPYDLSDWCIPFMIPDDFVRS